MSHLFKRLRKGTTISIFSLLFMWVAMPAISRAQTSLNPGDVMLVTVNSDGPDNFDFVPLVDLQAGTVIKFTDDGWDPTAGQFRGGEGIITYTASSSISAGTVVSYSGTDEDGFVQTNSGFNTSGSGDNILVYQGDEASPTFLYGAGFARGTTVWEYDDDTNSSGIPASLSESANTILYLGTTDNLQYDTSHGTRGTKETLVNVVGDESNWAEDDDNSFSALSAGFTVVPPPTVAFSTEAQSVTEGNSVNITVKLVQANNDNVSVDVVFLSSSSTADASDINGKTSSTVTFTGASTGATQNVTVNVPAGDGFEGREKAVFRLKNNSKGTIIDPDTHTLTINDSEAPEVVINEILYDPTGAGDANNDGATDGTDDEFVEFVNNSDHNLDISSWTVSDATSVKYTFKTGTVIPAKSAFVVFAKAAEGTGFGAAYLYSAGSLGLNNGGDTVTLADADANTVVSYSYTGSESNESITRNPDITGNFEGHSSADTDDGSIFSPGTKIDGTAFDANATYAIGLRGTEGYRFVATPSQNTTFSDLFANVWSQGIPNSDAPSSNAANIYGWSESNGGAFSAIGGMSNELTPGKGYIIYVYQDDNLRSSGVQGGFPKVVNTRNPENGTVDISVSSNDADNSGSIDGDEGYNLLGNPYGTDISVDAVLKALENAAPGATVNQNVYVWNNDQTGGADYETLGSGDTIAPFQAFFVRYTTGDVHATANFNRTDLAANQGASFYKQAESDAVQFSVRLGKDDMFNTYEVQFRNDAKVGEDKFDAYKLFSLDANTIRLYSTVGDGIKLARNVLPAADELQSELRIPLGYTVPASGKYTFSWSKVTTVPDDIELYLVDTKTNQKVNLRTSDTFSFNTVVNQPKKLTREKENRSAIQADKDQVKEINSRFELLAVPSASNEKLEEPILEEVSLSPNYPNPFSNHTTLKLTLKESMHVQMTIYNIVGQKVRTIADKTMAKGTHPMMWEVPSNMPSGIYICKVEAGGKVLTRKMTLVK